MSSEIRTTQQNRNAAMLVLVAALGYFVDIYDLILFNVVKKESLEQILPMLSAQERTETGMFLFNMQMMGMLIGGILWGVWGDKKGRLSVLFGSILLYSAANLANAFVTDLTVYSIVRVIAGIGLAGELGAGITLVAETMSKEKRGYGTMIIVTFGALGAVVAALVGAEGHAIGAFLERITGTPFANWQVAYIVGGTMGLALLLLRIGTFESGMFKSMMAKSEVAKGDIRILFSNKKRFLKYLNCILIGVPIWYIIGLLVANSQEIFATEMNIQGQVINGKALMYAYLGLSFGDLISGLLSQILRSRKKVVFLYLGLSSILTVYFLFFMRGASVEHFYFITFLLGTATGYWAIFVTIASEQFGTNIRSTVTNTVPNFVRGTVPVITIGFGYLYSLLLSHISAALIVGIVSISLAFIATYFTQESFAKDLDYMEGEE
jgi:putative MFS transporter